MKPALISTIIALLAPALLQAQEAPKNTDAVAEGNPFDPNSSAQVEAPQSTRVQVEYIEVAHKDLTRLMLSYKPTAFNDTDLRMQVQKIVEKGEANVIETQIAHARSGEMGYYESNEETIYPTQYELSPTPDEKEDPAVAVPVGFGHPTAFETRNVGSTLEIEPVIHENNKMVGLRLSPEIVWHTGRTLWQEYKDELGNIHKTEMPNFYILRFDTTITCASGQHVMAGVLSPKDKAGKLDPDRKIMIFIKCDILSTVP